MSSDRQWCTDASECKKRSLDRTFCLCDAIAIVESTQSHPNMPLKGFSAQCNDHVPRDGESLNDAGVVIANEGSSFHAATMP